MHRVVWEWSDCPRPGATLGSLYRNSNNNNPRSLIASGDYDVVVMQEDMPELQPRMIPAGLQPFFEYARLFTDEIRDVGATRAMSEQLNRFSVLIPNSRPLPAAVVVKRRSGLFLGATPLFYMAWAFQRLSWIDQRQVTLPSLCVSLRKRGVAAFCLDSRSGLPLSPARWLFLALTRALPHARAV